MTQDSESEGVSIGKIYGGVMNSIFAGRDVRNARIVVGGQVIPADKEPNADELRQLLTEIQKELVEISGLQLMLKEISPAAPYTVQGAEQGVKEAARQVEAKQALPPEEAKTVQQRLIEATNLVGNILGSAKTLVEKAGAAGQAVGPVVKRLESLLDKISVAAWWVAKLWMLG